MTASADDIPMPAPFARTSLPGRIVFGEGALQRLPGELDARGLGKAMLIVAGYDAPLAERGRRALDHRLALDWDETVGTSLHHALCHLLGGMFNAPHAQTHAIVLPYAISYLLPAIPESAQRLADALDTKPDELTGHIWALGRNVGTPPGLQAVGISEQQIDLAAAAAVERNLPSPRPLEYDALRAALQAAWSGSRP